MCVLDPAEPVGPIGDCLQALDAVKYHRLFSSRQPVKPGPKGPSQDVIGAVVDMKQRNPSLGVSTDRAADYGGLWYCHRQGCGATDSRGSVRADAGLPGGVVADHRVSAVLQRASHTYGASTAPAGAGRGHGQCHGESPRVSVGAALSWALSHASRGVTWTIRDAFTRAVYEFAIHTASQAKFSAVLVDW